MEVFLLQSQVPGDELSQAESGLEVALSEDEVETEVAKAPVPSPQPASKPRPKPRPAYKGRREAVPDNVKEGEISEKAKGKRKTRDDSDTDVVDQPTEKKSRRRAVVEEGAPTKPSSRGAGKSANEVVEAKPKRAKPASRIGPKTAPVEDDDNAVDDESAPKKRKRKINIFPAAQPTSFPWSQLPQVGIHLSCC